jgi:hypothetical protein
MQTKHFQRYEEASWEATDLFLIGGPDIAPICIRFQDSDPDKVELEAVDHMYRVCESQQSDATLLRAGGVVKLLNYEEAFTIALGMEELGCELNPTSGLLAFSGYKIYKSGFMDKDLNITLELNKMRGAMQEMAATVGCRPPVMYMYTNFLGKIASRARSPLLSTFHAMLLEKWAMKNWEPKNLAMKNLKGLN